MTMLKRRHPIERLLDADRYTEARRAILRELRTDPDNHWLLMSLSDTYYEQFRYQDALDPARRAVHAAPDCPLALWNLACTLDMLDRTTDAAQLYRRIITKSRAVRTFGGCWETRAWSRDLVNDCRWRLARIAEARRDPRAARRWMTGYIRGREAGAKSLYNLRGARKRLAGWSGTTK